MLVEIIGNRKPSGETESTVLGSFHVSNAARYPNRTNICLDGKGEPVLVSGTVRNGKAKPIEGVTLEVWQTNEDGFYDVQQTGIQPDNDLCSIFTSGEKGRYPFKSVYSRQYPTPDDVMVGNM